MSFSTSVAVEVIGGVVTAGLLGGVVGAREAAARVDANDREVAALNEDARRFLRDRGRGLRVDQALASDDMNSRGLFHSTAHLAALVEVKRRALQEYRDEMTRKIRLGRERRAWARRGGLLDAPGEAVDQAGAAFDRGQRRLLRP